MTRNTISLIQKKRFLLEMKTDSGLLSKRSIYKMNIQYPLRTRWIRVTHCVIKFKHFFFLLEMKTDSGLLSKRSIYKMNIQYPLRTRWIRVTHCVIKFKHFFFPSFWIKHSNFIALCPNYTFLAIFSFSVVQGSHWDRNSYTRFRRHFWSVARILAPKWFQHCAHKNAERLITWLRWYKVLVDCTPPST